MTEPKHSHYKKNVAGLSMIDVYRVLELFGVTDQALGHAIKKLLVAGGRGAKDIGQDVQESIDTLERWKEMRAEDGRREAVKRGRDMLAGVRHPMTPNVIEPASQIDDDSARMQSIAQNGNDGMAYSELDRLQDAADFNDDLPA